MSAVIFENAVVVDDVTSRRNAIERIGVLNGTIYCAPFTIPVREAMMTSVEAAADVEEACTHAESSGSEPVTADGTLIWIASPFSPVPSSSTEVVSGTELTNTAESVRIIRL